MRRRQDLKSTKQVRFELRVPAATTAGLRISNIGFDFADGSRRPNWTAERQAHAYLFMYSVSWNLRAFQVEVARQEREC